MASYVLSPAQYRQIKKTVIETILPDLVGRKLLPRDPEVGPGAQEVTRTMLDNDTVNAKLIPKGGVYPLVTPTEQEVTVYIRKIGQGFVVTDEDLESSQTTGRPLDKRSIQIASRNIQRWEDEFIFKGYSPVNEVGLYGSTSLTVGCANKWSSSSAEPYDDVNDAVGKIEANYFKPSFLILNYEDMKLLRRENTYGQIYLDKIVNGLNIPLANILETTALTKGTGMVCATGNDIAELKEVEPLTVLPPIRLPNDSQQINIRERLGMDVYQDKAFCTITNIS